MPGEAAGQLSDEVKNQFPDINWQRPARLRNRIVHGYWSIDVDILLTTATEQLSQFATALRTLLGSVGQQTWLNSGPCRARLCGPLQPRK